jgi:SPP1 gp7 family putative phage head morphogenesis protein
MTENIETIKQALKDDKTRMMLKNILIDWQISKSALPEFKIALEKKFGREDAIVFTSIDIKKLQTIILQMDLLSRKNVKKLKWFTKQDDEVCEICQEREGKAFPVDEIDLFLPAHKGCRCEVKPILEVSLSEQKLREILDKK